MRIWDRGTYECEKWEERKVIVSFEGERVRGRYALFRTGGEKDWMIHRMDPPAEPRDPFPGRVAPMLARPAQLPRKQEGWAAEIEWEGRRAIAYGRPGRLHLSDAAGTDVSREYSEVRRLARQLGAREAVLDGVLRTGAEPLSYAIFDLLYLEGRDLMAEPYEHRRELLTGLELDGEHWQTPSHSGGPLKELLAASRERGLPGLVLKRLDSSYEPGKRADSWRRVV